MIKELERAYKGLYGDKRIAPNVEKEIESNLGFYLSTIGLSTIGLFILKKKNK